MPFGCFDRDLSIPCEQISGHCARLVVVVVFVIDSGGSGTTSAAEEDEEVEDELGLESFRSNP